MDIILVMVHGYIRHIRCMINIPHNMTFIRIQASWTLQNVTDTTEYEIAIFIGVGWVCGHNVVLVTVHRYNGLI